jgi:hypothetical protein
MMRLLQLTLIVVVAARRLLIVHRQKKIDEVANVEKENHAVVAIDTETTKNHQVLAVEEKVNIQAAAVTVTVKVLLHRRVHLLLDHLNMMVARLKNKSVK